MRNDGKASKRAIANGKVIFFFARLDPSVDWDWPSRLDTYLGTVEQNESRKIYRAKTPSTQRKILCHFDRREKSFLDFSHPLGMTALGPSPWRPLRLCARHVFPISSSSEHFKYLWLDFSGNDDGNDGPGPRFVLNIFSA